MKTNRIFKFLCTAVLLIPWTSPAKAGEAAWNIATMDHGPTSTTTESGWSENGLTIEETDGKLFVRPATDSGAQGSSIQRRVQRTAGYDWLVLKIDRAVQPGGYRYIHLMLNIGSPLAVFSVAGNVPDAAYVTLKLPESSENQGILRLDSTMLDLEISDLGLYDDPLPRLELVMPYTSEEAVPASSEFSVELRLDAPAQDVSIALFYGTNTSPIEFSQGQPTVNLEPADAEKKIWRGKFSLAEATFLRGPSAAEKATLGMGQLLVKATVEGNAEVPEIWTASSQAIDLSK